MVCGDHCPNLIPIQPLWGGGWGMMGGGIGRVGVRPFHGIHLGMGIWGGGWKGEASWPPCLGHQRTGQGQDGHTPPPFGPKVGGANGGRPRKTALASKSRTGRPLSQPYHTHPLPNPNGQPRSIHGMGQSPYHVNGMGYPHTLGPIRRPKEEWVWDRIWGGGSDGIGMGMEVSRGRGGGKKKPPSKIQDTCRRRLRRLPRLGSKVAKEEARPGGQVAKARRPGGQVASYFILPCSRGQ